MPSIEIPLPKRRNIQSEINAKKAEISKLEKERSLLNVKDFRRYCIESSQEFLRILRGEYRISEEDYKDLQNIFEKGIFFTGPAFISYTSKNLTLCCGFLSEQEKVKFSNIVMDKYKVKIQNDGGVYCRKRSYDHPNFVVIPSLFGDPEECLSNAIVRHYASYYVPNTLRFKESPDLASKVFRLRDDLSSLTASDIITLNELILSHTSSYGFQERGASRDLLEKALSMPKKVRADRVGFNESFELRFGLGKYKPTRSLPRQLRSPSWVSEEDLYPSFGGYDIESAPTASPRMAARTVASSPRTMHYQVSTNGNDWSPVLGALGEGGASAWINQLAELENEPF